MKKFILNLFFLLSFAQVYAQATLHINLEQTDGPMQRIAAGLLNPGIENDPPDSLICEFFTPLNLSFIRGQSGRAQEFAPNATYIETVGSNVWSAKDKDKAPWEDSLLFTQRVIERVNQLKDRNIIFDFYNEPFAGSFAGFSTEVKDLGRAFKIFYLAVKSVDPELRVTGPGFENLVKGYDEIEEFIDYCIAHGVEPEYYNWHFGGDALLLQVDHIRQYLSDHGSQAEILITEYLSQSRVTYPGRNVMQLELIERSNIAGATRAQWSEAGHSRSSVGGLLFPKSTTIPKRGNWWVFEHYGQMFGERVFAQSSDQNLNAFGSLNEQHGVIKLLIGNRKSNANDLKYEGDVSLTIEQIASVNGDEVQVELTRIPINYTGEDGPKVDTAVPVLPAPEIMEGIRPNEGKITLNFSYLNPNDAYKLQITNARSIDGQTNFNSVAPSAPDEIEANGYVGHNVVKWSSVGSENIYGYRLYRSSTAEGPFERVSGSLSLCNSYDDNDVEALQTYFYKVTAVDSTYNESELSAVVAQATTQEQVIDREGTPVAVWDFEQSILPETERSIKPVLKGMAQYDADAQHNAHSFSFDGQTFIDIEHKTFTQAILERSVLLWVKPTDTEGTQVLYEEGGRSKGLVIEIKKGDLRTKIRNDAQQAMITHPIEKQKWVHLAVTFGESMYRLYVNGVMVDEKPAPESLGTHTNPPALGANNNDTPLSNSSGPSQYYRGLMDHVVVFEELITAQQIQELADIEVIDVSGFQIEEQNIEIEKGEAYSLNFEIIPEDATDQGIIWQSSAPTVATVNGDGVISSLTTGQTTITGTTTDGGFEDMAEVTVFDNMPPLSTQEPNVRIYPNPTTGLLHLDAEGITAYKIFNASGHRVAAGQWKGGKHLNLSGLPKRIYHIHLSTKQGQQVLKVVLI